MKSTKKTIMSIFYVGLLLAMVSIAFAYPVNINVNSAPGDGDFGTVVYQCTNFPCTSLTGSRVTNLFDNPNNYAIPNRGSGKKYFAEYDFQECTIPHTYVVDTDSSTGSGPWSYTVDFQKRQNCISHINYVLLSNNSPAIGQTIQVNTQVTSGLAFDNYVMTLPAELRDAYSTDVTIILYVDNVEISRKKVNAVISESVLANFSYTPQTSGTHVVRISTIFDQECKCSGWEQQNIETILYVPAQNIVCSNNLQCGAVTSSQTCNGLNFVTTTKTPTCINAGTALSYCTNVSTITNSQQCNHICSNSLGCDYTQCSDGVDNLDPEDTLVDYPQDPGCTDYYDNNESNTVVITCSTDAQCGNQVTSHYCTGLNFMTSVITPRCMHAGTAQSYCANTTSGGSQHCSHICSNSLGCDYTQCSDGVDNLDPEDTLVDYPQDPGCTDYYDNNESNTVVITCSNNLQCGAVTSITSCNGLNYNTNTTTPTCFNAGTSQSYCSNVNTITNNHQCNHICSNSLGCDYTQCSDGVDNTDPEDTLVDYPQDPGCTDYYDNNESNTVVITCSTDAQCGNQVTSHYCNGLNFMTSVITPRCMHAGTAQSYCANTTSGGSQHCSHICSNSLGCDYTQCSDGVDNLDPEDTLVDYPQDPGCTDYYDNNESNTVVITCSNNLQCGAVTSITSCNGLNYNTNTTTPTCFNAGTSQSYCSNVNTITNNYQCNHICSNSLGCDYTQCSDSADNDGDIKIDYPQDPGCTDYYDNNEYDAPIVCSSNLQCGTVSSSQSCNGLNFVTTITTPTCFNAGTSQSYCQNVQTPSSKICSHICSNSLGCDYTQCSDSLDNDYDAFIDYPADAGCTDYYDDNEYNAPICITNAQCGSPSSQGYCEANTYVIQFTNPLCVNAGTALSYCTSLISYQRQNCNNICSNTLGCDYTECSDSVDNDGDSFIDYPQDPGCSSYLDDNEYNIPQVIACSHDSQCGNQSNFATCSNLVFSITAVTPKCMNAGTSQSYCTIVTNTTNNYCQKLCSQTFGCDYTQCSDSVDNDGDSFIDYPQDPGCTSYLDNDEYNQPPVVACYANSQCGSVSSSQSCNGLDFVTTTKTPTCFEPGTASSYCFNVTTISNTQQCNHICSNSLGCDYTQCSDGVDNLDSEDTLVDYPQDPGCTDYYDNNETNTVVIICSSNSQCGTVSSSQSCNGLNFETTTTTPTCFNPNTAQSYCQNVAAITNVQICSYQCSNIQGCINPPINCSSNAQCGVVSNSTSCSELNFITALTTPTCFNAGTSQSYCSNVIGYTMQQCNYKCSPTLGCIPQPYEPQPIPHINYVDPDMAIERISLDIDQCITPGETLPIGIDFRNSGGIGFSNVKIQVAIPELGISRSAGPFKLKVSDSGYRSLNLYIPANTPPGEHSVRITITDGAAKRVQHRDIWVGDCPNWM